MSYDRDRPHGVRCVVVPVGRGLGRAALIRGVAALVLIGGAPVHAQQSTTAAKSLAFDGVTVVDVEQGRLLPNRRVVIAGNRIQALDSMGTLELPKGAQVVDARGKYLIPGLWDMHVHVSGYPQVFYPLSIANGVTGVRDMSSSALDSSLKWRGEIRSGTRVGPRVVLTGGYLGITPPDNEGDRRIGDFSKEIQVTTPERARKVVDSLKAAGVDFIKVRDGLSREVYFAAAAEARRLGIRLVGHFPRDVVTPVEVSDSGQRSIEHTLNLEGCSVGESIEGCTALAARFLRNGTWLTPTFVYLKYFFSGIAPERQRFWPDSVRGLPGTMAPVVNAARREIVAKMKRAGMPFLAGTDAAPESPENTPGFALHDELAMFVNLGLTPVEALRTATLNPAKFFNATDSVGIVAPGKLADLVLLDADPLTDITNTTKIRAVVANGRYFDRTALDQLVLEVEARAKGKGKP